MKKVYFKAIYKSAKIEGYVDFSDPDYPEWKFYHPLTNQECQELQQCFYDWSEQSEEANEEWGKLEEFFNNDTLLVDWVEQADPEDTVVVEYDDNGKGNYKYL